MQLTLNSRPAVQPPSQSSTTLSAYVPWFPNVPSSFPPVELGPMSASSQLSGCSLLLPRPPSTVFAATALRCLSGLPYELGTTLGKCLPAGHRSPANHLELHGSCGGRNLNLDLQELPVSQHPSLPTSNKLSNTTFGVRLHHHWKRSGELIPHRTRDIRND